MFEGFQLPMIDTGEAVIRVRHGGEGPPLLLLHRNPQTHVMWHKIAPRLATEFTVVAAEPERMIGVDPEWYLLGNDERATLWGPEALDDYLRCFRDP